MELKVKITTLTFLQQMAMAHTTTNFNSRLNLLLHRYTAPINSLTHTQVSERQWSMAQHARTHAHTVPKSWSCMWIQMYSQFFFQAVQQLTYQAEEKVP